MIDCETKQRNDVYKSLKMIYIVHINNLAQQYSQNMLRNE